MRLSEWVSKWVRATWRERQGRGGRARHRLSESGGREMARVQGIWIWIARGNPAYLNTFQSNNLHKNLSLWDLRDWIWFSPRSLASFAFLALRDELVCDKSFVKKTALRDERIRDEEDCGITQIHVHMCYSNWNVTRKTDEIYLQQTNRPTDQVFKLNCTSQTRVRSTWTKGTNRRSWCSRISGTVMTSTLMIIQTLSEVQQTYRLYLSPRFSSCLSRSKCPGVVTCPALMAVVNIISKWIIFFAHFWKVLPTIQTFCPVGVHFTQTVVDFAHLFSF